MLTINFIRENRDLVISRLKIKNLDAAQAIDKIISLDQGRRERLTLSESLQAEINRISKEIGNYMKSGDTVTANSMKEKTQSLKDEIKAHSLSLAEMEKEIRDTLI
ncbi:MAG: serine--tRNA ligase, partial [Bacteroidales bacterium]|nr:serine--tRNA ligase [Bacteroidales bacterium]